MKTHFCIPITVKMYSVTPHPIIVCMVRPRELRVHPVISREDKYERDARVLSYREITEEDARARVESCVARDEGSGTIAAIAAIVPRPESSATHDSTSARAFSGRATSGITIVNRRRKAKKMSSRDGNEPRRLQ